MEQNGGLSVWFVCVTVKRICDREGKLALKGNEMVVRGERGVLVETGAKRGPNL